MPTNPPLPLTSDQQADLHFDSVDALGVKSVDPNTVVTIDRPDVATLTPSSDPSSGNYTVTRNPGGTGAAVVNVTATLPPQVNLGPSIVTTQELDFDHGLTVAIECTATAAPLTPAS